MVGIKFTLDTQYKWVVATWLAILLDALLYSNLKTITQVYPLCVCNLHGWLRFSLVITTACIQSQSLNTPCYFLRGNFTHTNRCRLLSSVHYQTIEFSIFDTYMGSLPHTIIVASSSLRDGNIFLVVLCLYRHLWYLLCWDSQRAASGLDQSGCTSLSCIASLIVCYLNVDSIITVDLVMIIINLELKNICT